MDGIFHSGPKSKDYLNLGGASRTGGAQVDSKAKKESKSKKSSKVKQDVPQIGALGAFAALSGGMIGGDAATIDVNASSSEELSNLNCSDALNIPFAAPPENKGKNI